MKLKILSLLLLLAASVAVNAQQTNLITIPEDPAYSSIPLPWTNPPFMSAVAWTNWQGWKAQNRNNQYLQAGISNLQTGTLTNHISSASIAGNGAGVTNVESTNLVTSIAAVNTNQIVFTGLTNGVPPSSTVARLNGLVWNWIGHSYTNGEGDGFYLEPNFSGGQYWICTNATWHDINTPNIVFFDSAAATTIFQTPSLSGDFADGTAAQNYISGTGYSPTNTQSVPLTPRNFGTITYMSPIGGNNVFSDMFTSTYDGTNGIGLSQSFGTWALWGGRIAGAIGTNGWSGIWSIYGGLSAVGNPFWYDLVPFSAQGEAHYIGFGPTASSIGASWPSGTNGVGTIVQPAFGILDANPYTGWYALQMRTACTNPTYGQFIGVNTNGVSLYMPVYGLSIGMISDAYHPGTNGFSGESQDALSYDILGDDPRINLYFGWNGQRTGDTITGQEPLLVLDPQGKNFSGFTHPLFHVPLQVHNTWSVTNANWVDSMVIDEGTGYATNLSFLVRSNFITSAGIMLNSNGYIAPASGQTFMWNSNNTGLFGVINNSGTLTTNQIAPAAPLVGTLTNNTTGNASGATNYYGGTLSANTTGNAAGATNYYGGASNMFSVLKGGTPSLVVNYPTLLTAYSLTGNDQDMVLVFTNSSATQGTLSNYFTINLSAAISTNAAIPTWSVYGTNNPAGANGAACKWGIVGTSNSITVWSLSSAPATSTAYGMAIHCGRF